MEQWQCPVCSFFNNLERPGCMQCAEEKPQQHKLVTATAAKLISPENSDVKITKATWECTRCTFINDRKRPGCLMCAEERPIEATPDIGDQKIYILDSQAIVTLDKPIECQLCLEEIKPEDGIRLRHCYCELCRVCCFDYINKCAGPKITCPICPQLMSDRDIKGLLNDGELSRHHNKMLDAIAATLSNVRRCFTPDCTGFVQVESKTSFFLCPVCRRVNCLQCNDQHDEETCEEYNSAENLQRREQKDRENKLTNAYIKDRIYNKEAMECPRCKTVLMKTEGCDWILCFGCELEICWPTRGPRWGPQGNGDTSGGCGCTVIKKCHVECTNCH